MILSFPNVLKMLHPITKMLLFMLKGLPVPDALDQILNKIYFGKSKINF